MKCCLEYEKRLSRIFRTGKGKLRKRDSVLLNFLPLKFIKTERIVRFWLKAPNLARASIWPTYKSSGFTDDGLRHKPSLPPPLLSSHERMGLLSFRECLFVCAIIIKTLRFSTRIYFLPTSRQYNVVLPSQNCQEIVASFQVLVLILPQPWVSFFKVDNVPYFRENLDLDHKFKYLFKYSMRKVWMCMFQAFMLLYKRLAFKEEKNNNKQDKRNKTIKMKTEGW